MGIIIQAEGRGLEGHHRREQSVHNLDSGEPDDFSIHVGIGKLIQNLAVAAAETILVTWLFLAVDVPEILWTREVEKTVIKDITEIVG